jgi:hypothetical protein
MVFRIVTEVVAGVVVRVVAGVVTEGDEVYKHHSSTRVVAGGVRAHLNVLGALHHVEEKIPASPWRASRESANLALARVYDFIPRADEEPASSMERRGRRTGATHWDGSSSSPWNLTLLAGVADDIEEDGQGRGRGASSLQNLPLESRAIPATKTRKAEAREGDRRRKARQSVY